MAELERKIGQQTVEIDFKASLAACRGAAPVAGSDQRRAFDQQVEKEVTTNARMSGSDVRDGGIQPLRLLS